MLEREILSDTSVQACTSCLEQVHSAIRVHGNRHLLRPKVREPPLKPRPWTLSMTPFLLITVLAGYREHYASSIETLARE